MSLDKLRELAADALGDEFDLDEVDNIDFDKKGPDGDLVDIERKDESTILVLNIDALDEYIREIFEYVEEQRGTVDYNGVYETVLSDIPFVVFVGRNDFPEGIKSEIEYKIKSSDQYMFPVRHIDVRAQGGRNRGKLEEVFRDLQQELTTLKALLILNDRETVYRIYPDSISGM